MIKQISIKTKFGWISAYEKKGKIFRIKFGKIKKQNKSNILKKFKKNLKKFINKKTSSISAPYKIEGTKIQKKVWSTLKRIKPGQTKSYGDIAKIVKTSARYVGNVCGQNKHLLVVPCHRVIRGDGSLGGFSAPGGINIKKRLLKMEKNG